MQLKMLNQRLKSAGGKSRPCSCFFGYLWIMIALLLAIPVLGWAIDISDVPMETKISPGAPSVIFVLDDSGSMDWEFMTEQSSGLYSGRYYVFPDASYSPGVDHNYGTGHALSSDQRREWRSQWFGYNKIYYNPASDYLPWVSTAKYDFGNQDMDTPRSNPITVNSEHTPDVTIDMRDVFYTVDTIVDMVVVDNKTADGFTSSSNGWATYTHDDAYGDDNQYLYTSGNDGTAWAKWTPDLSSLGAGNYVVQVIWRSTDTRFTDVTYDVFHNGTLESGVPAGGVNQRENSGQWVTIGTWYFAATGNEYVKLLATDTSNGGTSEYCADAVRFIPESAAAYATVNVLNAHYFTFDDADADGELDSNENVYLVTWQDSDGDNHLDYSDDINDDRRLYFRVVDQDGDGRIEDNDLVYLDPVTDKTEIDKIRPAIYDDDGNFERFKTDKEDLQNFANWVSYYRRREHVAKAVVGTTISQLKYMQVGFYGINDHAPRMAVNPVKLDMPATVIVDNRDSGFSPQSGSWYQGDSSTSYQSTYARTSTIGARARWTPNIPSDGQYTVYAWWPCYSTSDAKADFTIVHDGGTDVVYRDQRLGGADGCGEWVELGTYDFKQGTTGYVEVERNTDGNEGYYTRADAVKFENPSLIIHNNDNTEELLNALYDYQSSDGTPLREALANVGRYFDDTDSSTGNLGPAPWWDENDGGECQKAFSIVMTDGLWNGSLSTSYGNVDGGKGDPYEDSWSNTLADIAMYYWDNDLSTELDNMVPQKGCDRDNNRQHMVTYTLSFGVNGTIDENDIDGDGAVDDPGYIDDPCFLDSRTPIPDWPQPTANALTTIDDLWHASVNGRGLYFGANNPEELVESMSEIFADIGEPSSGAAVAVNGEELSTNSVIYQARYLSGTWVGELRAYPLDPDTGAVLDSDSDILWNASDKLQEPSVNGDSRRIVTYDGTGSTAGIPFRFSSLTTKQKTLLGVGLPNGKTAEDLVTYLRGDEVEGFRPREKRLGDIVHSAPVLTGDISGSANDGIDNDGDGQVDEAGESVGGTIFAGANDGMLHAFDAQTGEERFAYIPNLVVENLHYLGDLNYEHKFFVDATVSIGEVKHNATMRKTYLVGGLGKGGKGYYCLNIRSRQRSGDSMVDTFNVDDITSSSSESTIADMIMWEYPDPDMPLVNNSVDDDGDGVVDEIDEADPDLGYSFSKGYVVEANAPSGTYRNVVIFGNGYNSQNGHAVLYVLDVTDGSVLRKIDTGVGGDNGLSTAVVVDVNMDHKVDYAYAGDLKGNLWKFDLTDEDPDKWGVAYGVDANTNGVIDYADTGDVPAPLFSTNGQPITARPDVLKMAKPLNDEFTRFDESYPGYMVIFGTGRFLGDSDRLDMSMQTIYGIWDYGEDSDDLEYVGRLNSHATGELSVNGLYLYKHTIVDQRSIDGIIYRTLSTMTETEANEYWTLEDDSVDADGHANNTGIEPPLANQKKNPKKYAGWFFDMPVAPDTNAFDGERVVKDTKALAGKALVISTIPNYSPCSGGGNSFFYIMNAFAGGRLYTPQFLNTTVPEDMIEIVEDGQTVKVPMTGRMYEGQLHEGVFVSLDDKHMRGYFSDSTGEVEDPLLKGFVLGMYYWREW